MIELVLDDGSWLVWNGVVGAAWLLLSWWMFCRRYLRIPHAFWVALLLSVIAYLSVVVIVFVWSQWRG